LPVQFSSQQGKRHESGKSPTSKQQKNKQKKQETGGNNSTKINLLMLAFPKNMLEKLLISAFSSPLERA